MKCHQCNNRAMYMIGPEGNEVPLCLNCYSKVLQNVSIQNDMLERQMNFIMDEMDAITGIPRPRVRYPERKVVQVSGVTLNNIKIDRSTIGVLNTGSIKSVDSAVTVLRESGEQQLSQAFLALTQAVLTNQEINNQIKKDILDILSVLSTEAITPKEHRRSGAVKAMLQQLSSLLSTVNGLCNLWEKIKSIFESLV